MPRRTGNKFFLGGPAGDAGDINFRVNPVMDPMGFLSLLPRNNAVQTQVSHNQEDVQTQVRNSTEP